METDGALWDFHRDCPSGFFGNLWDYPTLGRGRSENQNICLGWERCGEIPDYALWPRGGLCSTTVMYRKM